MRSFQLKQGTDKFDFDLEGNVLKNGAAFGKWTTSPDSVCNVIATKAGGGTQAFDVKWRFENNQLCLFSSDKKIFNFQETDDDQPLFSVSEKAVLKVRPIMGQDFAFELRGEWDMSGSFDLMLNVNGEISVLDGFIKNDQSLFKYFFTDNNHLYSVTFAGKWRGDTADTGDHLLSYEFDREDGSQDHFSLPGSARFDTAINQFVYEFKKDGATESTKIQLVGTVQISKNSRITYSIQSQKIDGKEKTTSSKIEIEAELQTDKFEGAVSLKYAVKKNGQKTEKVFAIGGRFTTPKNKLEVVFAFEMKTDKNGPTIKDQITFSGSVKLTNAGKIVWAFRKEANVKTLEIAISDVKFKQLDLNSSFTVISDDGSQQKTIRFMLGVKF